MGNRRRAREQALQVLYLMDLANEGALEALSKFQTNFENNEDDRQFVTELVTGVERTKNELDSTIEKNSKNWKMSRMPRIDRNILRLGAFQILHRDDIPPAVAIDECVELSKRFGDGNTPAFVNGILDRISRDRSASV